MSDRTTEEKADILVTGATGMIGSLLMNEFASRGIPVRAMVRNRNRAHGLADAPGVTLVEGDFDDPASLDRALDRVERAFLLTNSTEQTEAQQQRFVQAAGRAGAGIVKLSQLGANPESPVRFLRYHAAVEAAIRASGLEWTFVRPNLILQAYLPFGPMVVKEGHLVAPITDSKVSVIDARDIAAVAAEALLGEGHAGQTYTLTGPVPVTHAGIAAAIGDATGREVRFDPVPPAAFADALKGMGTPPWQADGLVEDYAHYGRGEAAFVTDDVERVTGTAARRVEDFARDYTSTFGKT